MDGIRLTKHFERRFQQRGLTAVVVEALLQYGSPRKTRGGAESLTFTKGALKEIRNDLGDPAFKACEKLKNAYIVVAAGETLITVARSYRKAVH